MKMVKRREINTPRRRNSLLKSRTTISKVISRPNSAISTAPVPSANVRVVVRIRPLLKREQDCDNYRNVVHVVDEQMLKFDPKEEVQGFFFRGIQQKGRDLLKRANKNLTFMFDRVFCHKTSTEEVFKESTFSLINSLMDGFNCSVFAYGATGAGKTFTMTGTVDYPGITFLTMNELFKKRDELSVEREFELGITYLEVYNELVKDLLHSGPALNLREDGRYGVTVAGLKLCKISNSDELFRLLEHGNKNRTQHPTDSNAESSRSHAVFQVYIQMTMKKTKEIRTAKLSMIDLAGSERGSATGCVGARFTEGANINKSLLALGNCINSLADGNRHVPYRDSKLTRLLKDSLGGNCQTVMIANISPSSTSFEDTYNTLRYATRAKKIKSTVKRNIVTVDMHVEHYVKMVEELKQENSDLKRQLEEEKNKVNDQNFKEEYDKLKAQFEHVADYGLLKEVIEQNLLIRIEEIIHQKQELLDRQVQLENQLHPLETRGCLKQDLKSTIKCLSTTSLEKDDAYKKIDQNVLRIKKQTDALHAELDAIFNTNAELDAELDKFREKHPQLKQYIKGEKWRFEAALFRERWDIEKKQCAQLIDDHEEKRAFMDRMALVLKTCYMQLKGHGFATCSLTKVYQDLFQDLQGRKTVKWVEIPPDSGVSSTTSVIIEDENHCNNYKRKMEEEAKELDETFDIPTCSSTPGKPKAKERNDMICKALKPPPAKRLANGRQSPRTPGNKENIKPFRKPFDPARSVAAARVLVATRHNLHLKGSSTNITKSKPAGDRPRFRFN